MRILSLALALAASPVFAGVDDALDHVLLPGFDRFAAATAALANTAGTDCRPEAVAPAFHAAWDAWAPIGDMRLGPSERGALSIVFWPDARGFTPKALTALVDGPSPALGDATAYAEVSIAARGLSALDLLLYDPAFAAYAPGSPTCALVATVTEDLAAQARALRTGWASFAEVMKSHGAEGDAPFRDEAEVLRALYTQILGGLAFTADSRIGRPMGAFGAPRPARAEAWRSGRSLTNTRLAVEGAVALAEALAGHQLAATGAALAGFEAAAGRVDPVFADVAEPSGRFRVEVLQQQVGNVHSAIEAEIGTALGLSAGFNSQDGD